MEQASTYRRRIHLLTAWERIDPDRIRGATAVVIDVLLATSNVVAGLGHGVERFLLARDRDETERIARGLAPGRYLRAGEIGTDMIREFEMLPLPSQFREEEKLRGQTVVLNTTNGTRAVHACRPAGRIVLASLLNARAVADDLFDKAEERITIVCAGNIGLIAYEDFFGGGMLVDLLLERGDYRINDAARAARDTYRYGRGRAADTFVQTLSGLAIKIYASEEEIHFAARENIYPLVPCVTDNSAENIEVKIK